MVKPEHVKSFQKHAKALDKLMAEIQRYEPSANFYLAMDNLHLMIGDSHNQDTHARQDVNSVACVSIRSSAGGDW